MSKKSKTIKEFEEAHGGSKIKTLEDRLAQEQAKIDALLESKGNATYIETSADCKIRFALIGDRHVGSLYYNKDAIHAFYEYAERQGIDVVYDCGDILDGHRIYKGQEFELRDIGLDAQIARLKKDSPRNIKTRFITGNHDSSFKHLAGVSVGKCISDAIPEYEFLGEEQARVEWITPHRKFSMMLIHPGGGSSYAISYRSQKIVESLEGGSKPNILGIGHYHKAEMMPSYRNVCVLQSGTFQRQTPFMARLGLAAHVGGWIVEATVGKDHNTIKAEFVAFY